MILKAPSSEMDITANLSEEGRKTFSKMNERIRALHSRVVQETAIHEQAPSDLLTRARNSVAYYTKMLAEQEEVTKRRLEAVKEECEKQRLEKEKWLEDAKERLEAQEARKPRSLIRAEQELESFIQKMKSSLPIPDSYFSRFTRNPSQGGSVNPPTAPVQPTVSEIVVESKKQVTFEEFSDACDKYFGIDEELKRLREQAKKTTQPPITQPAPEKKKVLPPPPPPEDDEEKEDDGYTSEDIREGERRAQQAREAREKKRQLIYQPPPPEPETYPPILSNTKAKKPIKTVLKR